MKSVKFVLNKLGVEHETVEIAVVKDTRTEDFKKNVNPNGTVPTVHHDDLQIYESSTAIRYLLDTFEGDETLLPRTDLKQRAKVDYWLDWNNTIGRPAIEKPLKEIGIKPKVFGFPDPSEEEKKELLENMHTALAYIESNLEGKSYLTGENLTVGDVQVYNEVFETKTVLSLTYEEYPNILAWLERVGEDEEIKALNEAMHKRLEG
eukprot:CAMPEP_0196998326 /NCGR_PEP_ID=MMETSP1380-20130617/3746_1 /TAXON_ID=5936 /ORGANISM="Euplotes crassus, Strain CT5" /LENGTH=205 /DNA_ID=CAMNT_0042414863 /DNA_START=30 /DNA_END=648 /DNA_ORIENTATION=-